MQRLLNGRAPSTVPPSCLPIGTSVLYYYKSTKNNEKNEWRPGKITETHTYFVNVRTSTGHISRVAYEDLRLRPNSDLTRALMEDTVDAIIATDEQDTYQLASSTNAEASKCGAMAATQESYPGRGTLQLALMGVQQLDASEETFASLPFVVGLTLPIVCFILVRRPTAPVMYACCQ